nr:ATP-binding protein [Kiritimatiellia bacterium]
ILIMVYNCKYIQRHLEGVLLEALRQFSAVAITGPRQSGKSTLLRHTLPNYKYITLDDPLIRMQANDDPVLFLDSVKTPVIIDEFQYAPELLHYIKIRIDENRALKGGFVLTGSQQFIATKGLSESLAGRIALLELPPFCIQECQKAGLPVDSVDLFVENTLRGCYPELVMNKKINTRQWYSSYVQTYIERDIRSLYDIGNLRDFERVLQLLAARCSQQLNYSSISRDVGVAVNTIKRWVSVLEACRIIYLLPAYYRNLGQRLVKAPKVYFLDSGLVCYLTGLSDKRHLLDGPMAGALFENFCVQEALKCSLAKGIIPRMNYLRTQNGFEVDLIVEANEGALYPFEFKLSGTPKRSMAAALDRFITELEPQKSQGGTVVCLTKSCAPLTRNVASASLQDFADSLMKIY